MINKIILITGATSGIGKQTAISLATMGATVVVTGRNQKNAEEAIKEIKAISKNDRIDLILADISTIEGIKSLVSEFKSKYSHLDILINNAGLAGNEFKKTMYLMYEYSQRLSNSDITINICYPGQASTSMTQNVTAKMLPFLMRPLFPLFKILVRPDNVKSAKKASRSSVYLATSKDVEYKTGVYCDKNMQLKEMPKVVADKYNRKYIWDIVTNLTNRKLNESKSIIRQKS